MIEPLRHNSWATLRLLDFCRAVDPAVLDATVPGTFGSIKETLAHVVGWEEVMACAVEGTSHGAPARFTSLADLVARARWLAERWERCLEPHEPHPDRLVEIGGGTGRRLVRVGTVLAQVVHHGNHHRSQVCTVLSSVDIEPPVLDAWTYATRAPVRGERRRRDDGGL